jgi:hypothetical protein
MAPPKKYSVQPNLFSFRCEKDKWGAFTLVARVKGTSPTEIFSGVVDRYIKDNQDILAALPALNDSVSVEAHSPAKKGARPRKEKQVRIAASKEEQPQ